MDDADLDRLLAALAATSAERSRALIAGLAAGWPADQKVHLTSAGEAALERLVDALPADARGPAVRLAIRWGSQRLARYAQQISVSLLQAIDNPELADQQRVSAANELVELAGTDPETVASLVSTLTPQLPPVVSSGVVRSLSSTTSPNVAATLVDNWPSLTPGLRTDAVAVLLARPATTLALLDAIAEGKIALSDLTLDQRQTLRSHPDSKIRSAAERLTSAAGATVNADRQKVIENYAAATHRSGNAAQGKLLFTKNCANCHKHSGEGNEIGPDLTGMAVHPKEELLVHILDPNRSVEGNFRRYILLTANGQVLSGMLAAESQSAVELVDAEGKRQSITREDIEQITSTKMSLMPEGFEQQLTPDSMTDLLEFLTSKGRFVPVPLGGLASAISDRPLFSDSPGGPDQMIFSSWEPKNFEGVPFQLLDPLDGKRPNLILLYGPLAALPRQMPRQVSFPCNMPVKTIHMLSGVSGWGHPYSREQSTSMIVRIHYQDGSTEDHRLINGVHFADYIRRVDVPESKYAFRLRGQQLRYLTVQTKKEMLVNKVELIKGDDDTAPMVMAITLEQY